MLKSLWLLLKCVLLRNHGLLLLHLLHLRLLLLGLHLWLLLLLLLLPQKELLQSGGIRCVHPMFSCDLCCRNGESNY